MSREFWNDLLKLIGVLIVFGSIVYAIAFVLPQQHIKDNEASVVSCHQQGGQLEYVTESDTYNCLLPK